MINHSHNSSGMYLKIGTIGEPGYPTFSEDVVFQAIERKLLGSTPIASGPEGTVAKVVSVTRSPDGEYLDLRLKVL